MICSVIYTATFSHIHGFMSSAESIDMREKALASIFLLALVSGVAAQGMHMQNDSMQQEQMQEQRQQMMQQMQQMMDQMEQMMESMEQMNQSMNQSQMNQSMNQSGMGQMQ